MGELMLMPAEEAERALTHRELDYRTIGGMSCWLMWNAKTDEPYIHLVDKEMDVEFLVPRDKALDAFTHPHVYRPDGIYNKYWDTIGHGD